MMNETRSLTGNNTSHLHRCSISLNAGPEGSSRSIEVFFLVCEVLGIMITHNATRTIHLIKLYNDLITTVVGCKNLISKVDNNPSKKDI